MYRVGQKKQRLWPWFEPPAAGAPMKYVGWSWDPALREWIKTEVPEIEVEIQIPAHLMPTEPPKPAQPIYVPGWYWYGRTQEWGEIPLTPIEIDQGLVRPPKPEYVPGPGQPYEVQGWSWFEEGEYWVATELTAVPVGWRPPPTLPPDVDLSKINFAGPMADLELQMTKWAMAQGLPWGEAHAFSKRAMEDFAGWGKNMTKAVYQALMQKYAVSLWDKIGYYTTHPPYQPVRVPIAQKYAEQAAGHQATLLAVLYAAAALVGITIGVILDGLVTPDVEEFTLTARANTYLLGPEDWKYSRHIDATPERRPIYVECSEIGTEYVRFRRGKGKGWRDIIDFPGGFLEEGYQFPYYVKYVWSYWVLEYVGMLYSILPIFYALKKGDMDLSARFGHGLTLPREEWCANFHWYL